MSKKARPKMAICYDFDGTLAAGNMQEYDYLPQLGIKPIDFWKEAKARATEAEGDEILAYMCLMLEKAKADPAKGIQVTKKAFADYAAKVTLFEGVEDWFERISQFALDKGVVVEHFIISSGIREMILGTSIAKHFTKVYASSYMYDQHGVAIWPALALNYTGKTQFLFRVNKGVLQVWDNDAINAFCAKDKRPVPFERMVYIGDGTTDVPCMRLVKDQGGHSIAVYQPKKKNVQKTAYQLLDEGRVDFVAPADYRAGKSLERQLQAVIGRIAADAQVHDLAAKARKAAEKMCGCEAGPTTADAPTPENIIPMEVTRTHAVADSAEQGRERPAEPPVEKG